MTRKRNTATSPLSSSNRSTYTSIGNATKAEWHFKESGSDIKEYTGKAYPARQTSYTITTTDWPERHRRRRRRRSIWRCRTATPRFSFCSKRDKGDVGQTLNNWCTFNTSNSTRRDFLSLSHLAAGLAPRVY